MHPDVDPVAFLLGIWRGSGRGVYPTIDPFEYGEEISFSEVGKPFLVYRQRTWALDDGRPLHAEAGYWRPQPGGRIEVILAHPTGITEIEEGTCVGGRIELVATTIGRTATAKEVSALTRRFEYDGTGVLRYTLDMAAEGQPLQGHLSAELHRVEESA